MDLVSWAYAVAERRLADSLPRRWAHARGVAEKTTLASALFDPTEQDLLTAAGVLHDVGHAPELATTGFHPLDGARYLQDTGFPERLCALVAHHSCAWREAELRGLSTDLATWPCEESAVRDALWWADMTTTADGVPVGVFERFSELQERCRPDDVRVKFVRLASADLYAAVQRTEHRLRDLTRVPGRPRTAW
ncbi:HD domain-containing protein [Actinosynnema sp. NPDC020468]|uniref:HD domain-containing protein n=1 Tax=Actinosynnema sp. NPDC020468 TaxID=3154488 RepID=UPI0033CF8AFE